ncbi:MAG: hypothetical protein PUE13_06915 [Clostridiales bacterium]|nr:hypothetical protein [Clostridiales bacterium]
MNIKKCLKILCCMAVSAAMIQPAAYAGSEQNTVLTLRESETLSANPHEYLGFNNDMGWADSFAEANGTSASVNKSLIDALKSYDMGIGHMRGFFHHISWKETVGPQRGSDANGVPYSFGLVEWINALRSYNPDITFTLTVNVDGSTEDVQDLVRFLTLDPSDKKSVNSYGENWAAKRTEYGLGEPVKLACLEMGNEWDLSRCDDKGVFEDGAQQEYIEKCTAMINGIKEINPDVKTAICAFSAPHGADWTSWNSIVIPALGNMADYIDCHYYYDVSATGNLSKVMQKERVQNQVMKYLDNVSEDNRPKVIFTEYAPYVAAEFRDTEDRFKTTDLNAALYDAEIVARAISDKDVAMLCHNSFEGGMSSQDAYEGDCWGIIRPYDDGTYLLTAAGEYYKMAFDAMKNTSAVYSRLSSDTSGENYLMSSEKDTEKVLSQVTFKRSDGGINIIFSNTNAERSHNVTLEAEGQYRLEKTVVLTSDNLSDNNKITDRDNVYAKETVINDNNKFSQINIPPQTVMVVYLAPMENTTMYGENADIKINGTHLKSGGNTIETADGKISVSLTGFQNSGVAESKTLSLLILKGTADINDVKDSDIVYMNSGLKNRDRILFDTELNSGSYIAYVGSNREFTAQNFTVISNETDDNYIKDVINVESGSSNYGVSFDILFANKFIKGSRFTAEVINPETGMAEFIGEGVKTGAITEYSLKMPLETNSGKFIIRITADNHIFEKGFDFVKPNEKISLAGTPKNNSGDTITFGDFVNNGTVYVPLRANGETAQAKVYLAVFSKNGRLLSVKSSQELSVTADVVTAEIGYDGMDTHNIGAAMIYVWSGISDDGMKPQNNYYIIKK